MSYASRFRRRQYVMGSLWIAPMLGALVAILLAVVVGSLEDSVDLPPAWQFSSDTASSVLTSLSAASVSLIGFVVTVTVLVVQVATTNLTPRSLRMWYRAPLLKLVLAVLTGTFAFTFAELRRITPDHVPNLGVIAAGFLMFSGILVFLLFLNTFIHRLRPVHVAEGVCEAAKRVIAAHPAFRDQPAGGARVERPATPPMVVRSPAAGVIQAIDEAGLVRWASRRDCLLAIPFAVGDFVSEGAVIGEIYGPTGSDAARDVNGMIAFGLERTVDQDPAFALRLMVDIAIRSLSPAVNDPTTAVQVLARIGDLLRRIGSSHLRVPAVLRDERGAIRVLVREPEWEDYLALGVTEIREYGGGSVQVVRALRSLLEGLRDEVVAPHRAAVEQELQRLDEAVERHFSGSADLDRARGSDGQGIGGRAAGFWLAPDSTEASRPAAGTRPTENGPGETSSHGPQVPD
jgi:uncharacterized membrane protein